MCCREIVEEATVLWSLHHLLLVLGGSLLLCHLVEELLLSLLQLAGGQLLL